MKNKYHYCQNQIEGHRKCKEQCEHCKNYYKPLEEEKRIIDTLRKPQNL